jgi:magnesium transporter
VRIEALRIDGDSPLRLSGIDVDAAVELIRSETFTWIDIDISDANHARLRKLLVERLDFHPATLDDCVQATPYHQPKLDEEQGYKFLGIIYYTGTIDKELIAREINIYIGRTYVITIHREPIPEFLEKFRQMPGHISAYQQHASLFLHHILDVIMNSFRVILSGLQKRSDALELSILRDQATKSLDHPATADGSLRRKRDQLEDMRDILRSRQALVLLRRTLLAEQVILRSLVDEYDYEGAPESSEEIAIYFRDISDRVAKFLEIIESEDRTLNHLMEVKHLVTNTRTNEIIYILTIISTVMLPLNLVVGFFGMNHDDLWLIRTAGGTWMVFGFMLLLTVGMMFFFKSKRWI